MTRAAADPPALVVIACRLSGRAVQEVSEIRDVLGDIFAVRSFWNQLTDAEILERSDQLRLVLSERLQHPQTVRHREYGDGVSVRHLFANILDRAFANLFQICDVGGLRVEHKRDVVARRSCGRARLLLDDCSPGLRCFGF